MQGRGQALLAAVSFGLGGGIGSLVTGAAWDSLGPTAVYLAATTVAMIGGCVALYAPRLDRRAQPVAKESASLEV